MKELDWKKDFDEMLDEDGPINIKGCDFYPSDILKKCDPIMYRQMMLDVADSFEIDLE